MEATQENERLRAEKRIIGDQTEVARDEVDRVKAKVANYKSIIKIKEAKIKELSGTLESKHRRISDLEE